jgi:3-oxoacyl-[acyl-carrier-protein] synthase-3
MGSKIIGTGIAVPPGVVTNADLAKVMDTDDAWIRSRSGVAARHFAEPGVGSVGLAVSACAAALADAEIGPEHIDAVVSATMTPDHYAPGNAPLIQARLGLGPVAAFDLRQQCSGFLYGMDLADALITSGRAETVLVVGSEVHAGHMPFDAEMWDIVRGRSDAEPLEHQRARATASRAWSVLFGDGAGAFVMQRGEGETGYLASKLYSDGTKFDLIMVEGLGFLRQPFVDQAQLEAGLHVPSMNGRELFRAAVALMPDAVQAVLAECGLVSADLTAVIAHQANIRIVEGVRKRVGLDPDQVPSNIEKYANTTAATLPLLFHETRPRLDHGDLVAFTAFGSGAHWGAALYRVP